MCYFWSVDSSHRDTARMMGINKNLVCRVFRCLEDVCSRDLEVNPIIPFVGTSVVKCDESKFNHKAKVKFLVFVDYCSYRILVWNDRQYERNNEHKCHTHLTHVGTLKYVYPDGNKSFRYYISYYHDTLLMFWFLCDCACAFDRFFRLQKVKIEHSLIQFNRGRRAADLWVFGVISCATQPARGYYQVVDRRDRETLLPILVHRRLGCILQPHQALAHPCGATQGCSTRG